MTLRVGLVGCGWIGEVYSTALATLEDAAVSACCASRIENARAFAARHRIPEATDDWRELVARDDVDVVAIGAPNDLHHPVTMAALAAGKHVIVEKPLAVTLEQCEEIVELAERTGLVVGYAENLCFAPKLVAAKQAVASGTLGEVRFVKQIEKHEGPHSRWFFAADRAGGGALMDMGCHGIEFARWLLGKPRVLAVTAHMDTWLHREGVHRDVTDLEDHVVLHLEFEGGVTALLESGWSLKGGMASRTEVQGTAGVLRASLLQEGTGLWIYSEKAAPAGWRAEPADWHHQLGYLQEMAHFLACVRSGERPRESAADGLAVLEIMLAAYCSAGARRRVELPFRPRGVRAPVDLWKQPPARLDD